MKRLLVILLLCCTTSALAARIEGRVVKGDSPLAGMQVRAYADLDPTGKPLAGPVVTDSEGLFKLEVPTGFAALYARSSDGRYFAFCGRNPLQVLDQPKPLWAGLQAVEVAAAQKSPYDDEYSASLEGGVVHDGQAVADAYVSLYLDTKEDLKGQGYRISAPTAADGSFFFDGLPESSYFLVARKRKNGARVGPLAEGDLLGVYAGNPLLLRAGETTSVKLPLVARQAGGGQAAVPDRPGALQLRGKILDEDGHPQAGLHVFAYRNAVIGHQRPEALSAPSGADGSFEISFREPGIYYIGARQNYGDSPAPGEPFGLYEGNADHSLNISKQNARIEIRVAPISLE